MRSQGFTHAEQDSALVGFKVDTKLFQELGELLVAKESTALVELIKNAYDADAAWVSVHGEHLNDPERGRIVVRDNGLGMTEDEFRRGFLTIAGRTKLEGERRSPIFRRRYTGEKGVGRLAAHKLGRKVEVLSRKAGLTVPGARVLARPIRTLSATIDWDAIERLETLDQIDGTDAVTLKNLRPPDEAESGTRLVIAPLRTGWGARIKNAFLAEGASLVPADPLWKALPAGVVAEPLLFDEVPVRDHKANDPGFRVTFEGELALPDTLIPDAAAAANWIAEIEFDRETGLLRLAVVPTAATRREFPTSEGFAFEKDLGKGAGPSFRSRIFQKSGARWDPMLQGIRVFMEGFRVPPYGDPHDDWLGLERDYLSRAKRRLTSLEKLDANIPEGMPKEELSLQGNSAYMGAVFLHRSDSDDLRMLVNREGFLPGAAFDFIAYWVRISVDLIVRLGYAERRTVGDASDATRAKQSAAAARADVNETPTALRVRELAAAAEQSIATIHEAIQKDDLRGAASAARELQPALVTIRSMADDFGREAVLWRVLASLGTELAAFVHEINALALEVSSVTSDLDEALAQPLPQKADRAVRRAKRKALELADRIRRNAAYLVDATSFEGRRRRSRQPLRDRFDAAFRFFETRVAEKGITLQNDIPPDLRTPPMFPSELTGIFVNLLSNAVKFSERGGKIHVIADDEADGMVVRVENTGTAVDLRTAARFFEAYRSTTENPDAVLGQGMGMGLTITRAFVQEYGGTIAFAEPSAGFATAVEFRVPRR